MLIRRATTGGKSRTQQGEQAWRGEKLKDQTERRRITGIERIGIGNHAQIYQAKALSNTKLIRFIQVIRVLLFAAALLLTELTAHLNPDIAPVPFFCHHPGIIC